MKFKPEDFCDLYVESDPGFCRQISEDDVHEIVERANAKLQEWLDAAPTLYGNNEPYFGSQWNFEKKTEHSHKAKLVCIEEIK